MLRIAKYALGAVGLLVIGYALYTLYLASVYAHAESYRIERWQEVLQTTADPAMRHIAHKKLADAHLYPNPYLMSLWWMGSMLLSLLGAWLALPSIMKK